MRDSPGRGPRSKSFSTGAGRPPASGGLAGEATGSVALPSERRSEGASFSPPVRVRRLRSSSGQPLVEIGRGILIDHIVVGEHLRVVIDKGPTLTTSTVQRLESGGREAVEVETANSVYLLERECGFGEAKAAGGVTDTLRRLNKLLLRTRLGVAGLAGTVVGLTGPPLGDRDSTQTVALASAPKPGPGLFHSGVTIGVTRIRGGDRIGDELRDLGTALLLDDLAVGEPARFSLLSGSTIVTSPVRGLEKLGAGAVQVVTRNSTYRFDLV